MCSSFAPLWNHNDYCCRCYNSFAEHGAAERAALASRKRKAAAAMARSNPNGSNAPPLEGELVPGKRTGRRTAPRAIGNPVAVARFCAVPWHYVLTFCSVEDLLRTAQACRMLTLAARPLLTSTMTIVVSYPPPAPPTDLRETAIEVADLFHAEGSGPITDPFLRVIGGILQTHAKNFDASTVTIASLSDGVALMRSLAAVTPRNNRQLPRDFGEILGRCESVMAQLQRTAPDSAVTLAPLVYFAQTLFHQQRIQRCAARYLSVDRIAL